MNDSAGHAAGDRLLRRVADAIRKQLRTHDLVIRYGGDEFVCVITGLELAAAGERLAQVNAELGAAAERGSVSVGLAQLRAGDTVDDVVRRADSTSLSGRGWRCGTPDL